VLRGEEEAGPSGESHVNMEAKMICERQDRRGREAWHRQDSEEAIQEVVVEE